MSIVPVLLTDRARAELTGGDAADPRGSEPLHKSCRRCGATLHAPGFTHDGPTGAAPFAGQTGVALRTTVPHTADRCACLVAWIAMQARRRGAAG
jgi:hypothetical protein